MIIPHNGIIPDYEAGALDETLDRLARNQAAAWLEGLWESRRPTLWLVGRVTALDQPPVIYGLYASEERARANLPPYVGAFILPVRPDAPLFPRTGCFTTGGDPFASS